MGVGLEAEKPEVVGKAKAVVEEVAKVMVVAEVVGTEGMKVGVVRVVRVEGCWETEASWVQVVKMVGVARDLEVVGVTQAVADSVMVVRMVTEVADSELVMVRQVQVAMKVVI